ncbi:hypothetical protein CK227_10290 [Mesorhizobium sp. WSM4308]|uniref:hypothetical protein n=1 Tax=Mesorhizobium sp. WSM4308 TaxID=2029409 RepID=UPI000BAFA201|nr:hypothetical protein [Mesorhizobium sp. WSM4308]PBB75172.1 hypothetical protein CK227_10290 [Mesorhizobium sp. WSM4308]
MTAHSRTVQGMATTLSNIGRQRPHQEVRVLTTRCNGSVLGPSRLVCVGGEYYQINADITYRQLLQGIRPDELELEPANPDEEDEFE